MKPDQAMQIVSQVLNAYRGTRQEHAKIQQAEQVLIGLLPKPKEKKKVI